ncbi:hypothetical protein [Robiginitalea sp.]|uniref:hypothetical protein n=1 Tax=Robiginitalea sp. TaxID=1902411 RepID=UPI003C4A4088
MVLTMALLLLAAILIYVLLIPLELVIDSYTGRYYLRVGFLARLSLEKDPLELLRLHLQVLFLNFYWRPSEIRAWGRKRKTPKSNAKSAKKQNMTLTQVRRLIRTFSVKALRLEIDTGNPVLNARLVPLSYMLGRRTGAIGINFCNRNFILLHVVNRPINILKVFINPKK